ncbi:EAL domain-containing protein [Alteriqipengyuania lutimaris]|uniref:EAL domain-containing protein n=2 Tax=Alteriqipengyuania lutimaris TaxID=1538146 RepID=A0A395LL22_9SPHN|nr:EAL domain-containing protein [Alteriqipengyuania lutimaris]
MDVPEIDTSALPERWRILGGVTLVAAAICGLIGSILPTLPALVAFLFASLLFFATRPIRGEGLVRDIAVFSAFALLPNLLVGIGFSEWMAHGGLPQSLGLAAIIGMGNLAAVFLGGRPFVLLSLKVGLWLPFVGHMAIGGDVTVLVAFLLATLAGVCIALFQERHERNTEVERQADERLRNRSIDIMREYEATGQGWFWETDCNGRIVYISQEFADRYGFDIDDLYGKIFTNLFEIEPDERDAERTIKFHFTAQSAFHDMPVRGNDGAREDAVWWSINGRPIFDGFDNFCGFRGSGTDLTERRRSAEHASRLAMYDSLTGLANRHSLSQGLSKLLTSRDKNRRACTILMLDLDRFKHVNDTFGHPTGDKLLVQVARRLEKVIGDMGVVGRLGGDEFKIIIPRRCTEVQIEHLAKEIIHSLSQPYSIEGKRMVIGVSVGIAMAPDHGTSSERVIRSADLALYAAKDAGRGRYHIFSHDLHAAAQERNQMEEELRLAVDSGSLQLHYQPVIDTVSERISGFEALLRWKHPAHGWISPEKFIPVAEDAGLIVAIGEWAIRKACEDLARWPETIRCAVNVSPLQFADPGLPATIARTIASTGIKASRLELEITESVFLDDGENTDATFAALKKVGVRLALDDFGTGYSSLGYLKNAPFDKIKIDQGFVRGATLPGSRNGAIIAAISSLAEALGMDTTAEGVETMDELDLIRRHGCSHIQGYIYSKPLSVEEADARLEEGLAITPTGPRLSREARQAMLRRVVLQHGEDFYNATVRNLSSRGALIEGLWNVPEGTRFRVALTERLAVDAEVRWCAENRIGVLFDQALSRDSRGNIDLPTALATRTSPDQQSRRTA